MCRLLHFLCLCAFLFMTKSKKTDKSVTIEETDRVLWIKGYCKQDRNTIKTWSVVTKKLADFGYFVHVLIIFCVL